MSDVSNRVLEIKALDYKNIEEIESVILDGLMAIKWQVHKSQGVSHYPMDKFFEHTLNCLHALLYKRLEELS